MLIGHIDYHQQKIEYWKGWLDIPPECTFTLVVSAPWEPEVRKSVQDVHAERIEYSQKFIRGFKSQLWAHRRRRAVEDTRAIHDESAEFLAELRGLSADVFSWLIKGATSRCI